MEEKKCPHCQTPLVIERVPIGSSTFGGITVPRLRCPNPKCPVKYYTQTIVKQKVGW